ncbi:uncharacterized protein LOC127783924 [Oryza glaberrima]|uniref:Uncharacterized protein n=1 Tax=Oryza barthii TaxID=65489 RepID=A0A0D3H833_9ORYZ|nr:uncharacterized protein LOC127783924 [Oryza glaberrima]
MGLGVHGPKSIGSRLTSGLTHFPFSRARVLSESPAAAAAAMFRSALRRGGAAVRHAASSSSSAAAAADGSPGSLLRRKVAERERARRRPRDPSRDEFFVATPESLAWLDSASLPMVLTAAAIALFTKLLMMEHDATDQERGERKIKNSHPDQGKVRMLTREEWDEIQEVRPRTPFESKLARPHARIRTGEPVRLEDVKDWATDMIMDAFTRAEESAKKK